MKWALIIYLVGWHGSAVTSVPMEDMAVCLAAKTAVEKSEPVDYGNEVRAVCVLTQRPLP